MCLCLFASVRAYVFAHVLYVCVFALFHVIYIVVAVWCFVLCVVYQEAPVLVAFGRQLSIALFILYRTDFIPPRKNIVFCPAG